MSADIEPESGGGLKRALGLTSLVLYGLGIIIGAGIYVLIGEVVARAGGLSILSFILAGGLAVLTGLSYAELSSRYPEAAGAAAYVRQAFGSDLFGKITGLAIAVMGVAAAASITRGGVVYLQPLVPLSAPVAGGLVIVIFTALACYGVVESVMAAALMSIIEIGGLLLVVTAGASAMPGLGDGISMIPDSISAWGGVGGGAFLAFFAFAGFENLANMAEETRDVKRVLPKAILFALGISTALYIADTARAQQAVNIAVAVPLTDSQNAALVSLAYNIGATAFANSTLVKKLNLGDYEGAADQFLVWNKVRDENNVLVVSAGLVKRRKREQEIFLA